jgi:Bacterial archaeo-eukaryotic release factor family 10
MIPDPDALKPPDAGTVVELLGWRPAQGVLSLYIAIDPGERGQGWRTAVRNGLSAVVESAGSEDHELRKALRATADRLVHDLEEDRRGEHRGLIGFVEVAVGEGEGRWYATQVPPHRIEVLHRPVAQIHELLEILDDGAPVGVAAVSSERVRLLDWRLGGIEQLHDWELEYFAGDWKERKSQRPPDPAHGEAVSASGRDQYNQRLEANRERFAEQTGRLAHRESHKRSWRRAVVFGDQRYVSKFSEGFGEGVKLLHLEGDLVAEPTDEIERRIEEVLPELNRSRETELIERIKEAAYAEGRSSLGVEETFQALTEGRVEHLVYDANRDYAGVELDPVAASSLDGKPLIERMVELALSSGARITPVEGESAQELAQQGGVAALLRY